MSNASPIILPDTIDSHTGTAIETARLIFVEHAADVDADDLLGPRERTEEKATRAAQFLAESMADGEWHDSAGLKRLACSLLGLSERTLQRAAHELDVGTDRRGFPSVTWWRLPQSRRVLTYKSCATVELTKTSELEPSQRPVAPVPPGKSTTGTTARLGDDMFPVMLAEAAKRRHITDVEAKSRYALHRKVAGQ